MDVQEFVDRTSVFAQKLEHLLVNRGGVELSHDHVRERLLLAHWSLIHDFNQSILTLVRLRLYGGALALLRPVIEAQVRAHIVLEGSDDDVDKIRKDKYRVNFKTIGNRIDEAFNLEGYYHGFLPEASTVLHSFTHSGLHQLNSRINGLDLQEHYPGSDILGVICMSGIAVSFVTSLVTYKFKLEVEREKSEELVREWCEWAITRGTAPPSSDESAIKR